MPRGDRLKLSKIIYDKLEKTVSRASIYDAILIICEYLIDKLSNGENVSIDNFGTLSIYIHSGHNSIKVGTDELIYVEPVVYIKFIPHDILSTFLEQRREKFKRK